MRPRAMNVTPAAMATEEPTITQNASKASSKREH